MLQLLLGFLGTLLAIVMVVAAYCAFSYAILYIVGKLVPLTGRHRHR